MKKIISFFAALILLSIFAVFPASAGPSGETPAVGTNTTYTGTAGSATARGGNITNMNFTNVLTQTSKWQGYYGNVTGEIMLGTSSTNKMYNWTLSTIAGEIFATQASTMNLTAWEDLGARTGAQIDSDFGFTGDESDNASETFIYDPPMINVSGRSINGGANTAAKTYNGSAIATWWTIALARSSAAESNYVFAGVISDDGEAFDNSTKDFQMIVPENEQTGVDTYYFYVELT